MYGTRTTTTNVLNQKQVNILKISRWSVRQKGSSLQEALESFGSIVAYLHYPQLQTTYVALKANPRALQHVGGLALGGRVTVECMSDMSIFEKEAGLAAPETSATITSESPFSEADIFAELQKYGSVRALLFTYSAGSRRRTCRASFYEAHSTDQLLAVGQTARRTLKRGVLVELQRAAPSAPLQPAPPAASCLRKTTRATRVNGFRQAAESKQQPLAPLEQRAKTGPLGRSLSQGASRPSHRFVRVFKDASLQIDTSLQIIRSRMNESCRLGPAASNKRAGLPARRRSHSSDSEKPETRQEVLLEISSGVFACPKDTGVRPVLSFQLTELCFLQIQRPRDRPSVHRRLPSFDSRKEESRSRESYLSQDDLSDGHSAQEMHCPPQTRPGRTAVDVKHEASDLQKTKHSSDSEQSCDKGTKLPSPEASYLHKNQFSLIQPHTNYRQMDALQPRSLNYFYFPDRVFSTS